MHETREWNRELIRSTWPHDYAQRILSIPILANQQVDSRFWAPNKYGLYTVKSAYHKILERVDLDLVSDKWEFKEVWKLNVPYKVRFFIWQGLQHVISTADILHMHHFATDEYCVLCGFEKESHIHLFVHCPFVRSLWFGVDIHPLIYTAITSSFHDWLVEVARSVSRLPEKENLLTKVASVLWNIWLARNESRFTGVRADPVRSMFKAFNLIDDMIKTKNDVLIKKPTPRSFETQIAWTPPWQHWVKLNTDGSTLGAPGLVVADAMVAEFSAVWIGLKAALCLNFCKIIIETNSKEVNFVANAFAKWATNLAANQQWWANPNIHRDDVNANMFISLPSLCSAWWMRPPQFVVNSLNRDMRTLGSGVVTYVSGSIKLRSCSMNICFGDFKVFLEQGTKIKPLRFSYLVSGHACTIEDENDFIEMMDVHMKKSIGEGSLLIFRQENEDMMEDDVPQSCSSPVYENRIREDIYEPSQLHETELGEPSVVPDTGMNKF
ncbi:hypothetical protein IFM89_026065 [Coptis chinensis]|uniref:Reverse transcriptase zinc-binding domain-containing protein n=1 Tax=Coptis chinensis TaxID=261450 RepID=A0A835M116_9MAGN|nr:hypothetical protein IFM89_026065 [Coptis chinensis]